MKLAQKTLLSAAALSAAALFLIPSTSTGFSLIGGSLGLATTNNGYQRDFRIFNDAADASANNNNVADASFPGSFGAVQAIWKAAVAWNSETSNTSRNFDWDFQGEAPNDGGSNGNTVSWEFSSTCSGGTLAYMVPPLANGWTIRVCEGWTWSDGPGNPGGGQIDLQGVVSHELGHALGLGHSNVGCGGSCTNDATMCPSICGNGTSARDTAADDIAGVQSIYGTKPSNKPIITGLTGSMSPGGTLTINGSNFAGTVNVKFTAGTSNNTGAIPGTVYNVSSTSSTQINVTIPTAAQDGNVVVWEPSLSRLSNPFPIDIGSAPPPPPTVTLITPPSAPAIGGQLMTLIGTNFTGATQMNVAGTILTPGQFSVVNDSQITFAAPFSLSLGSKSVNVTTANGTSPNVNYNSVLTPTLTLNSPNFLSNGSNATFQWGGQANQTTFFSVAGLNQTGVSFGQTLLLPLLLLQVANTNAAGTGQISPPVAGATAGTTIFTQVWTLQPPGSNPATLKTSNIESSTVLF